MKSLKAASLSLIAICVAGSSMAQTFTGGTFGYYHIEASLDDHGYDYQTQVTGQVTYAFSNVFSTQIDASLVTYQGYDSDINLGIHGVYALSDNVDAGAFFSRHNGNGKPRFNTYGVEIGYQKNGFDAEAHYIFEDHITSSATYSGVGGQVGYTFEIPNSFINSIEFYIGGHQKYYLGEFLSTNSLFAGLTVGIGESLALNFEASSVDSGQYDYFSTALTYSFGNGARFGARDFASVFPGY